MMKGIHEVKQIFKKTAEKLSKYGKVDKEAINSINTMTPHVLQHHQLRTDNRLTDVNVDAPPSNVNPPSHRPNLYEVPMNFLIEPSLPPPAPRSFFSEEDSSSSTTEKLLICMNLRALY